MVLQNGVVVLIFIVGDIDQQLCYIAAYLGLSPNKFLPGGTTILEVRTSPSQLFAASQIEAFGGIRYPQNAFELFLQKRKQESRSFTELL